MSITKEVLFESDYPVSYYYKVKDKESLKHILKNIEYIKELLHRNEEDNLLALGLLNEIFIKLNKQ